MAGGPTESAFPGNSGRTETRRKRETERRTIPHANIRLRPHKGGRGRPSLTAQRTRANQALLWSHRHTRKTHDRPQGDSPAAGTETLSSPGHTDARHPECETHRGAKAHTAPAKRSAELRNTRAAPTAGARPTNTADTTRAGSRERSPHSSTNANARGRSSHLRAQRTGGSRERSPPKLRRPTNQKNGEHCPSRPTGRRTERERSPPELTANQTTAGSNAHHSSAGHPKAAQRRARPITLAT